MQHVYLLYLFVTAVIGIASLSIATAEYLKTREKLLRSYVYFYTAFTVLVVSDLFSIYVVFNLPNLPRTLVEFPEYLNNYVVQYAMMVTFPFFIHAFFNVPQAKKRNVVFLSLAVILCLAEHVLEFGFQGEPIERFTDNIDNLILMLVFFYGLITGLSEYKQCEPEKARLAKRFLILLGIFMPAIMVDTSLYDAFPVPLYPIVYCGFSISFTYYLIQYVLARPQEGKSVLPPETEAKSVVEATTEHGPEGGTEPLFTEEIARQYNLSPREQDVLPLLLQGASNNQMADTLFISLSTVKAHLRNIYAKFDVKNRYELVALLKHGDDALIPRSDPDEHT